MGEHLGNSKKINCYNCLHYYVTWDKDFPMGCKALDFKTRYFPAQVVQRASGMHCYYFKSKKKFEA